MGLLAKIRTLKNRAGRTPKGLLRKSVESLRASGGEETTLPIQQGDGLLNTAQLNSIPDQYQESQVADEGNSDKLETRIGSISAGVDSVSSFFRILHGRFDFSKGALLVSVFNRTELIPCAVTGFDEQSISLLKIDPKDIPTLLSGTSSNECRVLSEGELDRVRNLFSDQDFSQLHEILLAPIYSDDGPISLLILPNIPEIQQQELQEVLSKDYRNIVEARYDAIEKTGDHRIMPSEELGKDLDIIRESTKTGLTPLLYRISFRPALENILAENPLINIDWLATDVMQLIGILLANLGNLYVADETSVLLVVPHASELDEQLVAHQTSASLRKFFINTEAPLLVEVEDQTGESLSADLA